MKVSYDFGNIKNIKKMLLLYYIVMLNIHVDPPLFDKT